MTINLHWEPGQPKHRFNGLHADGSHGYVYRIQVATDRITVQEISTHADWEVLTRYAHMDRDLDAAKRFAQRMENEEKINVARLHSDADGRLDV